MSVIKITQPKAWLLAPALGCAVNLKRLSVLLLEHWLHERARAAVKGLIIALGDDVVRQRLREVDFRVVCIKRAGPYAIP